MPRKTFSKKITSPELIAKINPENVKLAKRFLKEKSTRTSDKTIGIYESNLNIFFVWNLLYNDNKPFTEIKKLEFSDFFSFVVDEMKIGASRQNNLRSVLSSMSIFIERFLDEDYPNFRNVILRIVESAPKDLRREKTILTDEQVESLLEHLSNTDAQKACWLALAITSGARFSELLRFDLDIIDINHTAFGDIFIETKKQIKTKGRGKGGKLLYKYILRDKFLPYYNAWMEKRTEILKAKGLEHVSMFIKIDGTPATESTVRNWIAEFEEFLGVPFYAHALRHYLTTLLSKKNIPHPLIKEIFGWESLEMVSLYDDASARDKTWKELENFKM